MPLRRMGDGRKYLASVHKLTGWLSECEKHFDLSKQLGGGKTDKRSDFKQDIEYYKGIAPQNT